MNIVDPILFQCARQPPVPAICVPGAGIGLISYRRLELSIHNFSRRLHALGLPDRSVVAISITDVIFHAVAVLAAMRLGMIPLSVRGEVSVRFKIDAVISDTPCPFANMGRIVPVDLSWTEGEGHPLAPHLLPQIKAGDPCRLILTSGTSSAPKAVALSHNQARDRATRHLIFGNRIGNCSRIYCDVPISSSLGFQFLIYTLSRGGTVFFSGESFATTLPALEEYKVQCIISSPGGHETLLRWFDTVPSYQTNLDVIYSGGDILSRSLSDRLRSRVCSHLVAAYGSTEAGNVAIAHAHEIAEIPRAVGFVLPGVAVQIVDSSGTILQPGQEGQVRVRSECGVDGYFGDPEESRKVFRDGWFYPGDVGSLSPEGLLVITGREHAMLNLGGEKLSPEAIELVLAQFPGVAEAAILSLPNVYGNNRVCAVVVAGQGVDEQALRAHCAARVARQFVPEKYFFVDTLPRNEMSKLDRRRLQEMIQGQAARTV
jgi:acyl-coenzyme A synthetase/AMP-(fatty) acid ligase